MSLISNMHSIVGSVVENKRVGQSKSLITNIYSNAGWVVGYRVVVRSGYRM